MRLGAISNKIYWKVKLTVQTRRKRRKSKLSYRKLLKDERLYIDVDWNCLIIDWRFDGNVVDYLGNQLKNEEDMQPNSVVVKNYERMTGYTIGFVQDKEQAEYIIPSYQDLKIFLGRLHIKKIYVNELFGYDDLYEIFYLLMELKVKKECQLICLIHDCYCICPIAPWGVKTVGGHCTLRCDCMQCLKDRKCYENTEVQSNLGEWQGQWRTFLSKCDTVIAFSQSIKDCVLEIYRGLHVQVVPRQNGNQLKKVNIYKKMEDGKEGVSICIPAYNNKEYVRRLLNSIQIQTYRDYEVVITDDSSGQEVEQVVAEYAVNMSIRYYRNGSPLGPTRNNNRAISLAEKKYVKIMHHDDGQGKSSYEHIRRDQAESLARDWRNLYFGNWIGAPSVTIFRNKGWLFDKNLVWRVDCELYMRILSENYQFEYTELPLIYLGTSDTQLTKSCREDNKLMYDEQKYIYRKYKMHTKFRFWKSYIAETVKYNLGSRV